MTTEERLINPAPAVASIDGSIPATSEAELMTLNISANDAANIKTLQRILRTINNVCGPLQQYMAFNQSVDPSLALIMHIGQFNLMMVGLKAAATSLLDMTYLDIEHPPETLKHEMEQTRVQLEAILNQQFSASREMIALAQRQLLSTLAGTTSDLPSVQVPTRSSVDSR